MSLLEIHTVAHTDKDDLQCLQHGWSGGVLGLLTAAGDLALSLVVSESWSEWQNIGGFPDWYPPAEAVADPEADSTEPVAV